ncbi:MAG: FGGY family carbohydrate kinase, partial [Gordonibacter sp.]
MHASYVIALDQGTTSSRAMLVDAAGCIVDAVQNTFPQIYPHPGWVEHDPRDILSSQLSALTELMVCRSLEPSDIDSIGITNQRETTVLWNRETGQPVANAIVWQCRRTAPIIEELCGSADTVRAIADKTGLVPDAYFSASK